MAGFDLQIDGKLKSVTLGNADWYYGGGAEAWLSTGDAIAGVPTVLRAGKTVGVVQEGIVVEYIWHPSDTTDAGLVLKTSVDGSETKVTVGTGLDIIGNGTVSTPFVISNITPDQTVSLTGTGATVVSGTYPNFTINSTNTIADGSETRIVSSFQTGVDGTGTISNPYTIRLENPQKQITYPADFGSGVCSIGDDAHDRIVFIDNGANDVTINVRSILSTFAFVAGFIQEGTGTVTFVGSGVTLLSANGLKIKGQYSQVLLERKFNTNIYYLLGNTKI